MDIDGVILWGSLISILVSKDMITLGIWCRLQDDQERKTIFYLRYGWTMIIYGFVTILIVPIRVGGKSFLFIYSFFLFFTGSACLWWLPDIANCESSEHDDANGMVITNLDELDTVET